MKALAFGFIILLSQLGAMSRASSKYQTEKPAKAGVSFEVYYGPRYARCYRYYPGGYYYYRDYYGRGYRTKGAYYSYDCPGYYYGPNGYYYWSIPGRYDNRGRYHHDHHDGKKRRHH